MKTFEIYNNNDAFGECGPFEIEAADFAAACAKLADEMADMFMAWAVEDETHDDMEAAVLTMRADFIAGLTNETKCIYCGASLPDGHDADVPPVGDDAAWARAAELHNDGCEWVRTRAHRID